MDITWYLVLSAFIFAIGAAGVISRRNPLVVLLCLELMLNAGNLALVAFSRMHGGEAGQVFALIVMVIAACEVVIGLGIIVAMYRNRLPIDALLDLLDRPEAERQLVDSAWTYAATVDFKADLAILVDPLSVFMCLVVSGVSCLIHLYSVAYMSGDRGYARYFAYLNFFVFSMLLLVLAANFVILIIGWAFVGAAS